MSVKQEQNLEKVNVVDQEVEQTTALAETKKEKKKFAINPKVKKGLKIAGLVGAGVLLDRIVMAFCGKKNEEDNYVDYSSEIEADVTESEETIQE